ncbi:hypothetical protein MLC59_12490 [Marinobacter bryozoorum]|uniref:hypothetical protein n=1 Tax=Marinobacter bryozoorum TaxID=256324 RepID=UPI002004AA5C|nr:hypothetical protein [Marinobacter bryozoorum]MCK7544979.1 hypothetical protein [Marinobacter bryozoorum]
MKDRLEDFEPPLPPFSSCAVSADGSSGGSNMSHTYGFAAYVPEREVCEWVENNDYGYGLGGWDKTRVCETVPEHYVHGKMCQWDPMSGGSGNPEGCTMTYRYVDVFVDGAKAGHTYYWN